MSRLLDQKHYGPEPHYGLGPEAVHYQIHERAVGKTIARVYLGECEPIPELPQSEYTVFEFTDGSALMLQVGGGYSFHVAGGSETKKLLTKLKQRNAATPQLN